ncbi:MAG: hypothetical protein GTN49_09600 [candidate division Zixibacteria bacterium]|nr:hypothetical protein [candidate division Zixibacteria bacterium]
MRKAITIALAAAALLWVGATLNGCGGCGYDEKRPIATIDGKTTITVGDFVYHYKRAVEMAPPQDKPVINTFDDAKDFLDDIVTARVLEVEAEALGYADDEGLKNSVKTHRSNLLRERTRQKIEDSVKVTEAEILDHFNKNKEWRRVSFIVCDDKKKCEKAYAELKAGKPWDEVVKKYTIREENKDKGGKFELDFYYNADNVSRAVYETAVGKYTPVVEGEGGDQWFIFRVDEKIPGHKDEYAKVKDEIRNAIKRYKVDVKTWEYLEKLRKETDIKVDRKVYDALIKGDIADAKKKYNRKGVAVSSVGGIPVYFESWYEGMFLQLGVSEETVGEFRRKEPEQYKKAMDERLKALENDALLEYDAVRSGVDKDDQFVRDLDRFRAGMLVDQIYDDVFVATIPEVTEGEIREYFENHIEEFQDLERADVHVVAFPDKAEVEKIRAEVAAGGDLSAVAGKRVDKYLAAMEEKGELKKQPTPEKMPVSDFLTVYKEAEGAKAGTGTRPGGAEFALADELRPRVFKTKKGDVSEVFKLKDGRWAFFKYLEYFPFVQHTLDEEQYRSTAEDGAQREKIASPEVDRKCQAWFGELRAKHEIDVDEGALKMAYKKVQKL